MIFLFAGDVLLADSAFDTSFGVCEQLYPMRRISLERAVVPSHNQVQRDYCIANLEFCISSKTNQKKTLDQMAHRISPDMLGDIRSLPIDSFCVANNHVMQHGIAAYHETIAYLRKNEKIVIGNGEQPWAIFRDDSGSFAVLGASMAFDAFSESEDCCGYNYVYPIKRVSADVFAFLLEYLDLQDVRPSIQIKAYFEKDGDVWNPCIQAIRSNTRLETLLIEAYVSAFIEGILPDPIADQIRQLQETVDSVLLYLHWGNEYTHYYAKWQKMYADYLHGKGVQILIGCHSHAIQPVEIKDGLTTVFSLGNQYFNSSNSMAKEGILARVVTGSTTQKTETQILVWAYDEKSFSGDIMNAGRAGEIIDKYVKPWGAVQQAELDAYLESLIEGIGISRAYKRRYLLANLKNIPPRHLLNFLGNYLGRVWKRSIYGKKAVCALPNNRQFWK